MDAQEWSENYEWSVISELARMLRFHRRHRLPNWLNSVSRRAFDASPPVLIGECEFLAKRLRTRTEQVHSRARPETATLATPLFVAVVD